MPKKKQIQRKSPGRTSLRTFVSLTALAVVAFVAGYYGYLYLTRSYWNVEEQPPALEEEYQETSVFFSNHREDPEGMYCARVYPVTRLIPSGADILEEALQQLLQGPTEEETALGYFTNINDGVKIHKVTITRGEALIDFDARMQEEVGGSCRVQAIRAQITRTAEQFSSVQTVTISVEGAREEVLQP